MRVLAFLMILCAAAAQAQQPPTRSEAEFEKYVAERIEAASGAKAERSERLQLRLRKGDTDLRANLDRIWSACQRVPEDCAGYVEEYVAGAASIIADRTRPLEKEALRIVVRPRDYLRLTERPDRDKAPIVKPYHGDLAIALVFDGARSVSSANRGDLEALKLDEAQAFELARQNLRTRELKPLHEVLKPLTGKAATGHVDENNYESSRMVLHEDWKPFVDQIGGNLIVAVPATHVLLYGRGDSAEAVDRLRALARDVARTNQRPLSTVIFRWTPKGWEVVP